MKFARSQDEMVCIVAKMIANATELAAGNAREAIRSFGCVIVVHLGFSSILNEEWLVV
jgi:hypothetical protein